MTLSVDMMSALHPLKFYSVFCYSVQRKFCIKELVEKPLQIHRNSVNTGAEGAVRETV